MVLRCAGGAVPLGQNASLGLNRIGTELVSQYDPASGLLGSLGGAMGFRPPALLTHCLDNKMRHSHRTGLVARHLPLQRQGWRVGVHSPPHACVHTRCQLFMLHVPLRARLVW